MSLATGIPTNEFAMTPENYGNILANHPVFSTMKLFDRVFTVKLEPGTVSTDKLKVMVDKLQTRYNIHFDMIIVDYADNLAAESDQMYQSAGTIYNKLKSLAMKNKSVVLTASQPKTAYYSSEVIPFEGIAESSKKLHIVDITLTMGKVMRSAHIATMHIAKVREGETGDLVRLKLEMACQRVTEISEDEYMRIKSELYADPATKAIKAGASDE